MAELEVVDMETGELVAYEAGAAFSLFGTVDPDRALAEASRYAKALTAVVDQQQMFAIIGRSKHITVEGWQTLGSMTGVYAVGEGEPEPVEIAEVHGFKATTVAKRNGEIIGRATAYCMRDEQRWKDQPTYAIASMAQTRSVSKALKGPLGFIVKLAGYSATPAEEMPSDNGTTVVLPSPSAELLAEVDARSTVLGATDPRWTLDAILLAATQSFKRKVTALEQLDDNELRQILEAMPEVAA